MAREVKFKGQVVSENLLKQKADSIGITVDKYLEDYKSEFEITDETQEPVTEGKTNGAAAEGATATPVTGQAPESTVSESVDTSGELQPGEQGYFRQERRKGRSAEDIRSGVVKPKAFEDEFAVNVTSPSFNDLTTNQLQAIQDEAIKQLTSQYSEEENFNFDDTDIRLKAISIFENKVLPKVSLEKDTKLETFIKEKAPILNPYADFISDLYTAGKQGLTTSELVDPTFELLKKGSDTSDEDIVKWIEANKKVASKNMQSDEMRDFNRIYEENGSGIFGFIKGVASNPSVMPSLLVSSMATQLGSLRSEEVAGATALGAGTGAATGSVVPIVGTVTGAISGGIMAGAGAMESSLTFSELLQEEVGEDLSLEAVKELFNDEERVKDLQRKAISRGIAIGLVEGLTGGIAKGVTGKAIKAGLSKPVASAAGVAVESIGGGTGEVAGRVAAGQEMDIAEIGFEAITGTTTAPITVGSELLNLNNSIANYQINKELKNTEFNNIEQAFSPEATTTEAQIKISQNKKAQSVLDNRLKRDVVKGNITQEQADNTKKNFIETQGAVNKLKPLNLNEKVQADAVNLIKEKTNLQNEIKQVDEPSLTEAQAERIKEIDNSLREISKEAKSTETAKVGQAISQLEKVGIQTLSTEEIQSYLQNNNLVENQEDAIKKSGEGAFIVQNPDTQEQEIIVNKDIGSISDPSHEALHALIFQTVRKSPDTARRLGESLQEQLNKVNPNLIEDSGIRERLELYNQDPTAVQMEEVLTLFSDTVRNGTVKFNESTFTKIGDFIRQFLSSLGVKAKFNNGRDVYNFIKDYNKSIESGKLTKGQVRAAKEGVTGKLVGPKIETFVETPTIKESKIYQEVETFKDDLINQETKDATAFLIADKLENEVDRRLKIDVDPETKEDIVRNFLFDNRRGLLGLLQGYDPARNESIMGYLNSSTPGGKLLDARLIEFYENDPRYNQIVQSTTDEAVQRRAEQVTAEEVVTETAVKPQVKAIDPFRIMPDVKETVTAEVQKSIADKGVDITEVTYKELKDVAPYQTVADFFNIPVSRIKNPKDNLRKSDDVANIQRWILKNEPTLKNLFTEANRDVVEVKEGNKVIRKGGEPTAIPRNLLNKFYTKGDRVGNNFQWKLKPYDRTTFLEAVGIKDGKVNPNFTPRAAEAQTIKGILDMYTRNLGNVAARDIIEGREDIAPAEKARVKAEVAKGKPRLMFSLETPSSIVSSFGKATRMSTGSLSKENNITPIERGSVKYIGSKGTEKSETRWKLTKQEQEELPIFINNIAKLFGKDFFTTGNFAFGQRSLVGNSANLKDALQNAEYNPNAPALPKRFEYKKLSPEEIKSKIKEKSFIENQKKLLPYLKFIFKQIESDLKQNPKHLKYWEAVINDAQNSQSHFMRFLAPFKFYNLIDGKTVEEHSMPQSNVAYFLLEAALKGKVDQAFPFIENNYFQGSLLEADDKKTRGKGYNYISSMPQIFFDVENPTTWLRYLNSDVSNNQGGINPNEYSLLDGKTIAEFFDAGVSKSLQTPDMVAEQQKEILKKLENKSYNPQKVLQQYGKLVRGVSSAATNNNNKNNIIKFSKQVPNQEVLDNLGNADAAMVNARNPKAPVKKIRVFDFDDTLARSNSQVLYEMPDGTTGKLNATQFAQRAGELEAEGAEFDFSEFSKVVDGKRGPVFKAIENIIAKRGAEDVFILTARPADAAGPIKEFMDALGVNLPIENIVGLGDGKAEAKARWMTAKAAEGYNDFFFVDDAYKNVKAVQDALDVFDVKSKTQQAKVKFSKAAGLDKDFNDILEQSTGIASEKEYKRVKAEVAGASRGMAIRGIPYSAQDFVGLLYETLSKGELGDAQMAWYKTHLFDPYSRAMTDIDNARLTAMADYRALKKQLGLVPKDLRKKIPGEPFTREQAVRVYIWNQQGTEVPGISKADLKELTDFVENNAELKVFADQLIAIQKGDEYAKPKEGWPAGSITTDLLEGINTIKRAKYLEQWKENKDIIFSEKNMNKLEAAYGKKYRKALENMLGRMESGRNRNFSDDTLTARFTDWLQGSVGTIMFFNTRSALLQTLSSINFVNFTDNNPLAAAKAFANQKQYWSDFMTLINSDFLKARRSGLRINVNEADIADMAKKGGPKAVIGKLLQLGFTPTQVADSFAIASGGATFYRNRVKTYQKQGMSKTEAEEKAFTDFRENAEESQQSARPDRISMQQAGGLGRLILAFQNTPSQYARIIDKSIRDLKNGRGDAKTNISKIVYYSTVQNLLFNALQQAMFAFAFDDEEPEDKEKKEKYIDVANGMMDSLLRGTGLAGGVLSVVKNAIIRIVEESEKDRPKFEKVGADLLKIAPPVSSKLSKINQAARSYQWDKKEMQEKGWSLDNPAYLAAANVIAATTNVPLDRVVKKGNNVANATDSDLETWERLALLGGWQDWEIGIDEEKPANKPQPRKTRPKSRNKKRKTIVR